MKEKIFAAFMLGSTACHPGTYLDVVDCTPKESIINRILAKTLRGFKGDYEDTLDEVEDLGYEETQASGREFLADLAATEVLCGVAKKEEGEELKEDVGKHAQYGGTFRRWDGTIVMNVEADNFLELIAQCEDVVEALNIPFKEACNPGKMQKYLSSIGSDGWSAFQAAYELGVTDLAHELGHSVEDLTPEEREIHNSGGSPNDRVNTWEQTAFRLYNDV